MGAIRQRFTKAERATFTVGATVEVRDHARWLTATVTGDIRVSNGYEYLPCVVADRVSGRPLEWHASAKHVRMPLL